MAITRGLMQRELYGIGSYFPEVNGRSKFGLGSKLKRFVRKIIPNEVADIAVKAAPFVAPFNPLLAGYMSGIGTFDQTGSISAGVKSGLINYGLGQVAGKIGGRGFQEGFNPFKGVDFSQGIMSGLGQTFTSPTTGQPLFGQPVQPTPEVISGGDFGQFKEPVFGADDVLGGEMLGTAQQPVTQVVTQTAPKTFTQSAKTLLQGIQEGDFTQIGKSLKDLGGKALTSIYTNKDGSIDKYAVAATIAGGASYMEAKKLAEEAGLVEDADQYTEEMYNADKQTFLDTYAGRLPPSAFGITAKADGGRVGFASGSDGIPSITLTETDEDDEDSILDKIKKYLQEKSEGFSDAKLGVYPGMRGDLEKSMAGYRSGTEGSFATGGRVGLKDGSDDYPFEKTVSINPMQEDLNKIGGLGEELEGPGAAGAAGLMALMKRGIPVFSNKEKTLVIRNLAGRSRGTPEYKELGKSIPEVKRIMDNPEKYLKDATILKEYVKVLMGKKDGGRIGFAGGTTKAKSVKKLYAEDYYDPDEHVIAELAEEFMREGLGQTRAYLRAARELGYFDKKDGGIINVRQAYAMGSPEENAVAASQASGIPLNTNPAGTTELDMRNTGGFVPPVGVKEKADDIPAMLSNNEFVFTADAVRAAGGGSVNKGAQKMYALMKQLEGQMV